MLKCSAVVLESEGNTCELIPRRKRAKQNAYSRINKRLLDPLMMVTLPNKSRRQLATAAEQQLKLASLAAMKY